MTSDHSVLLAYDGSNTAGRSDLKAMLLGSVSSGVVHHATRPVVVVRGER